MAQNGSYFNFTDKVAIVTGASLSRRSGGCRSRVRNVAGVSLLAQMFQGLAHWRAGNFDYAVQRVAHFQDHKNCPRDGQGTDEEDGDDSGVAGS